MKKIDIQIYNWDQIQQYYKKVQSQKQVCKKFQISIKILNHAKTKGKFKVINFKRKHTQQTKKYLSEIRKKYLCQHPQKHVWKNSEKFKSEPCQFLKKFLKQNNISFISEYNDYETWKHNYSIDIAFPVQKIGIQINGNMHYDKNCQLKEYYKIRHNILQSYGWKIYQFHYSLVYKSFFQLKILQLIKQNINYDYQNYTKQLLKEKLLKNFCLICNNIKSKNSLFCRKCVYLETKLKLNFIKLIVEKIADNINNEKITYDRYYKLNLMLLNKLKHEIKKLEQIIVEQQKQSAHLKQLVKEHSLTQIGKMYGVSSTAIKKRCMKYNIDYKQYKHKIQSDIAKKISKQKYKDYINPKTICPICGNRKKITSKICKQCFIKNRNSN